MWVLFCWVFFTFNISLLLPVFFLFQEEQSIRVTDWVHDSAATSHSATSQDYTEKFSLVSPCLSGLKKIFTYFKNPPQKSLVCIISSYASRENYFQQYTLSLHHGFLQQYYSTKTFVAASCDLFLFKLSYLKD